METNKRNYKIILYDPQWPILFSEESERINRIVGDNILEIYHIGSTSVPGMSGKATIDILFVVDDISKIDDYISHLKTIGYTSLGSRNAENSRLFEKEVDEQRLFIIHFYQNNHPEIFQIIAIRDYLRTHKDKADQYGEFKLALFQKFPNDYSQYRKLKDEYMNDLKKEAIDC
jgi:GrpB-like predicted nucleotidyltransferase (UPF0157 family)